ncbi:glycosyl hydrolase family 28-related protein [Saxibacter everestensis]|uniref:Glycosyl hydrolase family 28-related protein n=1 Tax=Saxibacter everestensis TaxID=2909229 RepID=A0ABY8QUY5_9MICO|nr:glycosyl hydrolase family 28-related protein [Brevibacteriaceae bacterium ZFBP1038]
MQLPVWDSFTGGAQVTDLKKLDGTPLPGVASSLTAQEASNPADVGRIVFQAPDQFTTLYLDRGYGSRWAVSTLDIGTLLPTAIQKADLAMVQSTAAVDTADEALAVAEQKVSGQVVSVLDYGAKGDGVTDDYDAFVAAFQAGKRVFVPAGIYRIRTAILVPSGCELFGEGMDRTIIRLTDTADPDTWVVTNANRAGGDAHIYLHDFTADWNCDRPGGLNGTGGSRGSCVTFGQVQYGYIDRVKAINAGLHGFDVCQGTLEYPYMGDGYVAPDRSQHVWISNCIAHNWGDDGFTTHHSDYIHITNCYAEGPRQRGNNNGFEVDDGSRFVTLTANTSENCYGGVEIKAHHNASAGQGVTINGHMSIRDVRSYNWRHIGHHVAADPLSVSAFSITATNLTSLHAGNRTGFYEDASARCMSISAFVNVNVNGLLCIGDPLYDYADGPLVALQYKARNVNISNVTARGFNSASTVIYCTGGDQKVDSINISNIAADACTKRMVQIGSDVKGVNVTNVTGKAATTGALYTVDAASNSTITVQGVLCTGFPTAVRHNSTNYATVKLWAASANNTA